MGVDGKIKLSGLIDISANPSTINYGLILPPAQGLANTVLQNDGSGNLSWGNKALDLPGGVDTNIQYNNGGVFAGDSNFAWNNTNNTLAIQAAAAQPTISLTGSTSGTISIQPSAITTSYGIVLPSSQGIASSILTNDGAGNLTWSTVPAPSAGGNDTNVQFNNVGTTDGSDNFTWNNTNQALTVNGSLTTVNDKTPTVVGSLVDPINLNGAIRLEVVGSYAYVASQANNSLTIVDISDTTNPVVVSTYSGILNNVRDIFVAGKYAFVVSQNTDGFEIVNISNPNVPAFAGVISDPVTLNGIYGIFVCGIYAYCAAEFNNALTIVDVSNPAIPVVVGSVGDPVLLQNPRKVVVRGEYAYVACEIGNRMTIVNISNPAFPFVTGSYVDAINMFRPEDIYVSGKYCYVCAQSDSITILDITDPTTPTLKGQIIDAVNLNNPYGITVLGQYAYIVSQNGNSITILDVSDPSLPTISGVLIDPVNINGPRGISISGKYIYIACLSGDALTIVDTNSVSLTSANIGNIKTSIFECENIASFAGPVSMRSGLESIIVWEF